MAKQRGVVQLSGRVDNLCYYQQKRVRGGLVRRVNLAMSERVRTGSEYINLRKANSFFGGCSMIAAGLISLVNSRSLFMTRADRQAYLTKEILQICYTVGLNPTATDIPLDSLPRTSVVRAFNSIMKVNPKEFFISLPMVRREVPLGGTTVFEIPAIELERYLNRFNGLEVQVNFYYGCYVSDPYKDAISGKFSPVISESNIARQNQYWSIGDPDLEIHATTSLQEDYFNCIIIRFDIVSSNVGGRRIIKNSASTACMIGIEFS